MALFESAEAYSSNKITKVPAIIELDFYPKIDMMVTSLEGIAQ